MSKRKTIKAEKFKQIIKETFGIEINPEHQDYILRPFTWYGSEPKLFGFLNLGFKRRYHIGQANESDGFAKILDHHWHIKNVSDAEKGMGFGATGGISFPALPTGKIKVSLETGEKRWFNFAIDDSERVILFERTEADIRMFHSGAVIEYLEISLV